MQYHVSQGGVNIGKFGEAEILSNLSSGNFTSGDHYWTPGMAAWMPLSEFGARPRQPSAPVAQTSRATVSTQPQAAARPQPQAIPQHRASLPQAPQAGDAVSEERVRLFGFAGAGLLTLGTFGPFISLGIFSFTILQDWNWMGVTVLICGIASAAITYARYYAVNWVTAGIPSLIFAYMLIKMTAGTRGDDVGAAFARSMASPGWGLFAMCLGIAALGACAWLSKNRMKKTS